MAVGRGDGGGAVRDTCCSRAADTATLARAGRGAARACSISPAACGIRPGREMRVARDELCPTGVAAGRDGRPSEPASPADLSAGPDMAPHRARLADREHAG